MYIFELIYKLVKKEIIKPQKINLDDFEDEYANCEHIFLPIDSTKKVLACSKCGLVVNSDDLKPLNFFKAKQNKQN